MTIDISLGTVSATLGIATVVGKVIHSLVSVALDKRDDKIEALEKREEANKRELESAFRAVRDTQGTLFAKLDTAHNEFQAYKLHVAENYVGEAKLEKLLAPVINRLDGIERDLRQERSRP